MPYSVDEKHSPSEFYYPGETNATFQGEDNAEQNSNKNGQGKVFSGLSRSFVARSVRKRQAILSRTDLALG